MQHTKYLKFSVLTFGILGILGTTLLFCGAELISNYWIQIPESKNSLMILSPAIFLLQYLQFLEGILMVCNK